MTRNDKDTRKVCETLHEKEPGYRAASNIDFLIFIVGLVLVLLAVRAFVLEPVKVDGPSMMNTLQNGERCLVEKVSYWFSKPKAGDVVIVHFPEMGNTAFVKRVVATAGQTVEVRTERNVDPETNIVSFSSSVYVDGVQIDESAYGKTMLIDKGLTYIPVRCEGVVNGVYTVPEGCVFVMGDHRTNSKDSRDVGAIPLYDVIGRVHGVMYPFKNARGIR